MVSSSFKLLKLNIFRYKLKISMKKLSLLLVVFFISMLNLSAQLIKVDMIGPTDTLFFDMDALSLEVTNTINFNLTKVNKFKFGQVNMKAHAINPFDLPKIYLNKKLMNTGIFYPNLNEDVIFYYNIDKSDTNKISLKSPIGEHAADLNFVFSNKDLIEGDNEIKFLVSSKQNQNILTITDLKLYLRTSLNSDIVKINSEFPGGQKGWVKYLEKNLNRDLPVNSGAPYGKYVVIVTFMVDKEGNLFNIKAENNPGYGTMEEALRVIKNGPKWIPASKNGEIVVDKHRQAIVFVVS